jgi:hypothetical protein
MLVRGAADIDVVLATASETHSPAEVLIAACDVLAEDAPLTHGSELVEGDDAPALSVRSVGSFRPTPQLTISVPPFTLSTRHVVTQYPDAFGLRSLMDRRPGHLPNISDFPLALDNGLQQVTATFSAEGFRAAAVTALEMRAGGAHRYSARCVTVVLDHPFAFLARHRPTGLLVVVGVVAEAEGFSARPNG